MVLLEDEWNRNEPGVERSGCFGYLAALDLYPEKLAEFFKALGRLRKKDETLYGGGKRR